MENGALKKHFEEILLALKVDDIKEAIRADINPHFLNEYLIIYNVRRKKCHKIGIDIKKYDEEIANLTDKLNFVPVRL